MKDIENFNPDAEAADLESAPYVAILPLVRLLARQAAREDYARALEAGRVTSYSTRGVGDAT